MGRNSGRLVTIDRSATRTRPAAFNMQVVSEVPMTNEHQEAIGVPAVPGAQVTMGVRPPTRLREVIGTQAAQVGAVAIGHKVVLGLKSAAIRKPGLDNLVVPANIGRSLDHPSKTDRRRCTVRLR